MVEMVSLHDASDAQQPHVPIVRVVDDDDKVRRSPVASFVTCVCLR